MANADEEARAIQFRANEAARCADGLARSRALAGDAGAAQANRDRWAPFLEADVPVACEDDCDEPARLRSLSR